MDNFPISWWPIFVAATIKFVIGALWYSPVLFATEWMRLINRTEAQVRGSLPPALVAEAVCDIFVAYVLFRIVRYAGAVTVIQGGAVGLLAWIGFIATYAAGQVYYEGRPWKLWAINTGYWLVSLVLMGALLAVWR